MKLSLILLTLLAQAPQPADSAQASPVEALLTKRERVEVRLYKEDRPELIVLGCKRQGKPGDTQFFELACTVEVTRVEEQGGECRLRVDSGLAYVREPALDDLYDGLADLVVFSCERTRAGPCRWMNLSDDGNTVYKKLLTVKREGTEPTWELVQLQASVDKEGKVMQTKRETWLSKPRSFKVACKTLTLD
jgi:hypothetical protein